MSDASLSTEQAQKLLQELASNDLFRSRFAEKPAAALVELGIPHETVINLNAQCLVPRALADKSVFQDAHDKVGTEVFQRCLSMNVPSPK
jgi:putative modified peptide